MKLDFVLTAQDHELFGGQRYSDPLGLGPVWTNLARRVVPHFTGQSNQTMVLESLLSAVALYELHCESYRRRLWIDDN
jgi:hypothetical protein